ncbi:MAG: SigE family RNA polymerase sigma factor [Propionibacteriaceae bacterium]|nr:SigE family RNA polymerase sigma factor [Propionibacteriaceae bacterium]
MISKARRDTEFSAFAAQSAPYLSRTASLLCPDRELAKDLVQDALVKTYVHWSRVRGASALAYARKILVNANIDRWRARRELPAATPPDQPAAASPEGAIERRDQIRRLLASLPQQQRKVIVLRYLEDLSEQAVAEELGISLGAVKSAASRGLAKLKAEFSGELV